MHALYIHCYASLRTVRKTWRFCCAGWLFGIGSVDIYDYCIVYLCLNLVVGRCL